MNAEKGGAKHRCIDKESSNRICLQSEWRSRIYSAKKYGQRRRSRLAHPSKGNLNTPTSPTYPARLINRAFYIFSLSLISNQTKMIG